MDQLTATAVWTNARNLPEPPSLPGLDEELPAPTACALHFIENGKSLMVSYIDHGIVYEPLHSLVIDLRSNWFHL